MKETITIKNFGGLKDAVIPLNSINIFIGKQASGKSVTAKLIYFFKRHLSDIFIDIINEKTEEESNKITLSRFAEYFPREVWEGNPFTVKYELGNEKIKVEYSQRNDLQLNYSSKIKNLFSIARKLEGVRKSKEETGDLFSHVNLYHEYQKIVDKQFGEKVFSEQRFVPAGRSYFAHVENNVFSILSTKQTIDPFLISFGADYQLLKTVLDKAKSNFKDGQQNELLYSQFVDNLISDILVGNYTREDNKDYIVHKDKRKINVTFSSSGQQETLPLLVVLKALTKLGVNNSCVTTLYRRTRSASFSFGTKENSRTYFSNL